MGDDTEAGLAADLNYVYGWIPRRCVHGGTKLRCLWENPFTKSDSKEALSWVHVIVDNTAITIAEIRTWSIRSGDARQ